MEICISAFRAFAPPPHPLSGLCCLCCRVDRKVCTSSVVNSFGLNCTTNLSGFILSAVQDLLSTGHALHCTALVGLFIELVGPGVGAMPAAVAFVVVVMILHYDDWVLKLDRHPHPPQSLLQWRRRLVGTAAAVRSCGSSTELFMKAMDAWQQPRAKHFHTLYIWVCFVIPFGFAWERERRTCRMGQRHWQQLSGNTSTLLIPLPVWLPACQWILLDNFSFVERNNIIIGFAVLAPGN